MNLRRNTGALLMALLLLVTMSLPAAGMAASSYDNDALKEYAELWMVYYETHEPAIKVDASTGVKAWAHGSYKLQKSGMKHTIAEALTEDSSPVTFLLYRSTYRDQEFEVTLFDEYLTEIPQALTVSFGGRTLTSAYDTYTPSSGKYVMHYFTFPADGMLELTDRLLAGGEATFLFTTDKGESSVKVSQTDTPRLVEMFRHVRNGWWYFDTTSSRYKSSSLLPEGPRVTPTPYFSYNVPSGLKNVTLREGDSGNGVLTVKKRMQELGYYRSTATVDESFNSMMTERLKEFQKNNGLPQTGIVDAQTLNKLYDSSPVKGQFYVAPTPTPRPEGKYMLVIPSGGNGQWKKLSGDKLQMRVQVKNESRYRTVEAFELYIYTEDVWGDRNPESGRVYTCTTIKDVGPGKTAYSDYFVLPHRSDIYQVYVGVKQMRYEDGTIETISDSNVDYFYWSF